MKGPWLYQRRITVRFFTIENRLETTWYVIRWILALGNQRLYPNDSIFGPGSAIRQSSFGESWRNNHSLAGNIKMWRSLTRIYPAFLEPPTYSRVGEEAIMQPQANLEILSRSAGCRGWLTVVLSWGPNKSCQGIRHSHTPVGLVIWRY